MLARLAENLYWHGRYLERSENLARLINVNAHLMLDLPGGMTPGWAPLVRITGNQDLFSELYDDEAGERQVVRFLLSDERNPGSIRSTLALARENLRSARDLLPREVWEQMNGLYLKSGEQLSGNLSKRRRHEYLRETIADCQLIGGLLLGTMSHNHAYDFIVLGRYLERADMTTRILDVRSTDLLPDTLEELPPFDSIQWMSVLKSLTAYQMYRRHVRLRVTGPDVLRFLLRDDQFPRAIAFCLGEIARLLAQLPGDDDRALRAVTRLMRIVDQVRVSDLKSTPLSEFMDDLQVELADIGAAIEQTWFRVEHD